MWRKMTIFKDGERLWGCTKQFKRNLWGGDLDEVIDVQITKSRDLWYFLNEISLSDIDEIIDFQKIK